MKKSPVSSILFYSFLFAILVGPLIIFYHLRAQNRLIDSEILMEKEKITSLTKLNEAHQISYQKILALKKSYASELLSLHENKLESLFYATQLARKHQLSLVKSRATDDQSIEMTLRGNLGDFSIFLSTFLQSKKVLHLKRINITTHPSLTFEIDWDVPLLSIETNTGIIKNTA